ncbi:MAG: hypothetical protein JWO38_1065 [Gemmataceae bacterium]|nr:hypothetical protein [Gemmataceae bacterium]
MFFRINTQSISSPRPVAESTRQTAFARCARPVRRTGMGRKCGLGSDAATRTIVGGQNAT